MNKLITLTLIFNLTTASAQFGDLIRKENPAMFKPGRYYDRKGNIVEGLIDYSSAPKQAIFFKSTPEAESVKFTGYDLKGVVIEQDTFASIFLYTAGDFPNQSDIINGFGQVLETGKMTLYKVHYGTNSTGHIFQQANMKRPVWVQMELPKFVKQMTKFMKDQPQIVAKLNNNEYSYFKLRELVHDYNASFTDK
jgi:hypothetical protein